MVVQFNGRIFVPGVLMRALRSDQAEQEGTDFVTILNASQKKFFPDSDIHDWTARYNTIKRLAEDLVRSFARKPLCRPIKPC